MKKPPDPQIVGLNNFNLEVSRNRLIRGQTYRDLSTVILVATRGVIPARVVQSWMNLATPMNQKAFRLFIEKMEVGDAYNTGIETILNHPELSKWKYLLTIEEDNIVPPDGLLKLYESMDRFDGVSALYWTKGENGQPMIYGSPSEMPMSFVPQMPIPDTIVPCNGIGMGMALFKIEMFKKVPRPWFKTLQQYTPGIGMQAATQDLYFCQESAKYGFKFAVDCRVRSGHYDHSTDTIW